MAEQRASDGDRERAAEHLRRAGGDGRLTLDELGERVQLAYEARTRSQLEELLADVEEEHAPVLLSKPSSSSPTVRPGPGGSRWVVSMLGGATRTGGWRVAERCRVVNVMGGSDVDLSGAELAGEDVTVTVFSLMGGADVYVPEGVRVEISDFGFMGGNDVQPATGEPRGGPVIRLRLVSIMGGTNVRRGSKAAWKEARRAAKQQRRHELHRSRDER